MRAAVLREPGRTDPLVVEDVPKPVPAEGEALLKVLACGVCRTDLHIAAGELPQRQKALIPGPQIVAEVLESPSPQFPRGTRVGVSWVGGTDGTCKYRQAGRENLCDHPTYTDYSRNGDFAEYTTARADFLLALPEGLSDTAAAPLLSAGIIGFRSLRVAEVGHGQRIGLFGFGSSAQLTIKVLQAWGLSRLCQHEGHTAPDTCTGARCRIGGWCDGLPLGCSRLCRHLRSFRGCRPGGASIRRQRRYCRNQCDSLDRIPQFDYDTLLWGERQLRSVANMTRQDGRHFLRVAEEIQLTASVETFPLGQINQAMQAIQDDLTHGSAVVLPAADVPEGEQ